MVVVVVVVVAVTVAVKNKDIKMQQQPPVDLSLMLIGNLINLHLIVIEKYYNRPIKHGGAIEVGYRGAWTTNYLGKTPDRH